MSEPLFLVDSETLVAVQVGETLLLDGAEGRHAASVARVRAGERIYLGDGAGRRALTEVVAVDRGQLRSGLRARVLELEVRAEPDPRFVLVQALAKAARDEQAIETATELGVDEIVPWQAERSIVRWRPDREASARRRWESVVTAASKQSRRHRIPLVAPLAGQAAVLERVCRARLALVLHEEAIEPLSTLQLPDSGEIVVVVGPEGGATPTELGAFTRAGAKAVRLGEQVLRSSSAGPAALAVLSARSRWR